MMLRKLVSALVPVSVAFAAFLHAQAIGALVDATIPADSIAPFAEARAAAATAATAPKSADAILDRNPFDHVTGSLRVVDAVAGAKTDDGEVDMSDPLSAPPCEGVRVIAAVRDGNPEASFAALDVRGKKVLQKRGGMIGGEGVSAGDETRVVYIAADRVWLLPAHSHQLCQARLYGAPPVVASTAPTGTATPPGSAQSPLEATVAKKIVKTGPNEFQIDRGAVDMILEAQTELMKTPLVPEKEGDRLVGFRLVKIKPGSVLSSLGLETGDRLTAINGIDVTSTENMMQAYARLRAGGLDRFNINVVRGGKPTTLDYVIK